MKFLGELSLFGRASVAVLAITALLCGVPSAAMAEDPTFPITRPPAVVDGMEYVGTVKIVNAYTHDGNDYCLDAHAGGGGAPNSPVGLWNCNAGPTLLWNVYNAGGPGKYNYRFINYVWNRSLDYPAASNGANFWQYGVYDYVNSQGQRFWLNWRADAVAWEISVQLGGDFTLMDAYGTQTGNGTPVRNGPFSNHRRQQWFLRWV